MVNMINEFSLYGNCEKCNLPLNADWFIDKEFEPNSNILTGRIKYAVDYLYCPYCLKKYPIDDTFDGPWHYPKLF